MTLNEKEIDLLNQVLRSYGDALHPPLEENDWHKLQSIMDNFAQSSEGTALNAALSKTKNGFELNETRFEIGGKVNRAELSTLKLYFKDDGININDPFRGEQFLQHSNNIDEANFILLNTHGRITENGYSLEILETKKDSNKLKNKLFRQANKIIWLNACYETNRSSTAKEHLQKNLIEKMSNSLAESLAKKNTVIASSFRIPCWLIHEINVLLQQMLPLYSGKSIGVFFQLLIKRLCRKFLPDNEADFQEKHRKISEIKKKLLVYNMCKVYPEDFLSPLFFWIYGSANLCLPDCAKKIRLTDDIKFTKFLVEKVQDIPQNSISQKKIPRIFLSLKNNNGELLKAIEDSSVSLWLENENPQKMTLVAIVNEQDTKKTELSQKIINLIVQKLQEDKDKYIAIIFCQNLHKNTFEINENVKSQIIWLEAYSQGQKIECFQDIDILYINHKSRQDWLSDFDKEHRQLLDFFYTEEQQSLLYLASCKLFFPRINPLEQKNPDFFRNNMRNATTASKR